MRPRQSPAAHSFRLVRTVSGVGTAIFLSAASALAAIPIPVIDATEATTGFSGGSVAPHQQAQQPQPIAVTLEPSSPYVEIGAGFNFLEATRFSNAAGAVTTGSQLNFDIGPAVTGALGYAFGNGWRAEFELGIATARRRTSPYRTAQLSVAPSI
jgi:hypothetical protein